MFVQTLNESLNAYLTAGGSASDLPAFVEWVTKNPPSEKVGPKEGTITHEIFAYCLAHKGEPRKDIVTALVAKGLNPYTVMTQYQRFLKTQTQK